MRKRIITTLAAVIAVAFSSGAINAGTTAQRPYSPGGVVVKENGEFILLSEYANASAVVHIVNPEGCHRVATGWECYLLWGGSHFPVYVTTEVTTPATFSAGAVR